MQIQDEILVNQFAQGVITQEPLVIKFNNLKIENQKIFLNDLKNLIIQSKPIDIDIDEAIKQSRLKPSYTPCVLIKKGVDNHHLDKIINLPDDEIAKVFILFMSLFKIAYLRRYQVEKNDPYKWWYWDLSDEKNIESILSNNGSSSNN